MRSRSGKGRSAKCKVQNVESGIACGVQPVARDCWIVDSVVAGHFALCILHSEFFTPRLHPRRAAGRHDHPRLALFNGPLRPGQRAGIGAVCQNPVDHQQAQRPHHGEVRFLPHPPRAGDVKAVAAAKGYNPNSARLGCGTVRCTATIYANGTARLLQGFRYCQWRSGHENQRLSKNTVSRRGALVSHCAEQCEKRSASQGNRCLQRKSKRGMPVLDRHARPGRSRCAGAIRTG